jgi:hypothetical protein
MWNRMLRSVLVAAFSAVVAFGALSGLSGAKSDIRADSKWPTAATSVQAAGDTSVSAQVASDSKWPVSPEDGGTGS